MKEILEVCFQIWLLQESSSILLYLDEQQVESNVFFGIHPYDVALVKYFPPGQSQIPFNQGMGILDIYSKKGDDLNLPLKLKRVN